MTQTIDVAVIMGSSSDYEVMQNAVAILEEFGVSFKKQVVSAHRTPDLMYEFAKNAHNEGIKVIIAGAGGAAHLPGMVASLTHLPVIGVPVKSSQSYEGLDSLLSIVQMPAGVPVATVGINNAKNAGLLAVSILAIHDKELAKKLINFKKIQEKKVLNQTI
jgi:5-(carboxyamino)imidazole ribonucleotide mutase